MEMMSNIPVAGMVPSLKTNDEAKENILLSLKIAVRQIQSYYSMCNADDKLSMNVSEVQQLCDSLDKTLFYGLRECQEGYWPFVRDFTHSNTVRFIEALSNAPTRMQSGRAWLCLALNENSLECYFRSFRENQRLVKKHYLSLAFTRDEQRMQLLMMLMSGLENILINLEIDKICFGTGLTFFSSYFYCPNRSLSCVSAQLSQDSSQDIDTDVIECEDYEEISDKPDSSICNMMDQESLQHGISRNLSSTELERIAKYITMAPQNETFYGTDLEVIRTKVVRRVKKSPVGNRNVQSGPDPKPECQLKSVSSSETIDNKENRLSKVTTDSGVSLESQCSSDCDSTESGNQMTKSQLSFEVGQFQAEFNVTFSTPIRKTSSDVTESGVSSESSLCPEERGVPEGQEDPSTSCCSSTSRLPLQPGNDGQDDDEDEEEEISIYDMKKGHYLKLSNNDKDVVEEYESVSLQSLDDLESLSDSNHVIKEKEVDPVAEELRLLAESQVEERLDFRLDNNSLLFLLVEVYELEEERFFKMFYGYLNIMKGNDQMVLFLLTNKSAYVLKSGGDECKFVCCDCTKYSNIEFVSVNLNYQGFTIVSKNNHKISLYTATEHLTRSILSNMEVAIRRSTPKIPLPGFTTDAALQLKNISKYLASELKCTPCDICLHHFVLARWEDFDGNSSSSFTPTGPKREGFLMYRKKHKDDNVNDALWHTGYFILNGGVLYCMNEDNRSMPLFFIQLSVPHCKGCRRLHLPMRPYAFEVILADGYSLQLAAADDNEASAWQYSFLHVVSLAGHFVDNDVAKATPCCLMICNDTIIVAKELSLRSVKTLGRASLCDLTAVFFDSSVPNCILLEFEISEASESYGEWIVTFDDNIEKEKFLSILQDRWSNLFQVPLTLSPVKDLSLIRKLSLTSEEIAEQKCQLRNLCYEA